jgi:hypothetical protein
MDLAELKFVVDTKELETAATRITELGTAVNKLNKPMQELTRESAKTNKELSKAEESAAKAALAQHKLEQAQTKSTDATRKSASVLERQNLILEYMAQGNSKGQASILATAKAAGALDDEMLELNKTLVTQRTLIGGDPFDKSIGLMQKLQNEYKTTTEVTNLFNKNLGLTEKQMTDLAREKERLIALYGIEGKSLDNLGAEYDQLIQKSAMINRANDARTSSMKAQVKAQDDAAKAHSYLITEIDRVNRLTESNGTITSTVNNKLIKFEQALKATGQSASQQVAALEKYKASLLSIQKAGGDRQVDYLSRALGPQITDIFVGLYSGQSPMTVLVQQGGQLRDQFALAGVEGAKMGEMLVKAAGSMLTSIKDVGLAVGQVFVTAIVGAGKSVTNFAMQITGANVLLDIFRAKIIATAGEGSFALKAFDLLGKGVVAFAGIITFTAIAALVALGVAMVDVIKEENALNRALNLTGAAMGVSLDMAYDAAKGMNQFGVSTGTALEVLTEMAKMGGMSADSLEMVSTTAKAMKTAFDIPIADTVKQFKELQEKPTESLTKLAVKLGTIPVEILKQVDAYERAGDSIKAAELATKTYADAGKDAADRVVEDFGVITRLGISIGEIWNKTWESILGIGRKGTIEEQIAKIRESLPGLRALVAPGADVNDAQAQALELAESELRSLLDRAAAEKNLAVERKANADQAKKFEDDKKKRDEAAKKSTDDAKKAQESFAAALETAKKFYEAQVGAVENLTKSEIALNKVREDTDYKAFSDTQKKQIDDIYQQAAANEMLVKAEKDRTEQMNAIAALMGKSDGFGKQYYDTLKLLDQAYTDGNISLEKHIELVNRLYHTTPQVKARQDAIEKLMQAQKKSDDALFDSLDVEHQLNMQVLEQTDLLALEGSLIAATDAERKRALANKRLDLQLEKEIADIKKKAISKNEQDAQIARAEQRRLEAGKNVNTEIAQDFAKKQLEELNRISNGITDSIVTALIEGGEEGGKKLRALLEAELTKPVTVIVNAVVNAALGSVTGGGGGSDSLVSNLLGKAASSISIGGTSLATMGQYFATGFMNTIAGTGAAAGATAGGAIGGSSGMAMQIGAYGPYALAAAAVLNALGAFRTTKQVGGGISGTLGGTIDQYGTMRKSGTLFRGPDYFRQNQGTFAGNEAIQASFQQLKDSTTAMADTLKLSSAGVENFTKTIDISFDGLTNTQIEEKIAATLGSVNDELAALVLGAGATAEQLSSLYNSVMQQRYDLETQLLELQGKTLELRERERAKIHEANQGLFDQIKALEDQKEANEKAAEANEKAAEAMQKLTNVTTTIVDEINRLRGVSTSKSGLESQFAILTAQARSGDLGALAQLPEITRGLEQIAASTAVNATDIIFARARLAQSLQDTLGYTGGLTASPTTSMASIGSVSASGAVVTSNANSASSNQELLAALVTEVQGLRVEMRADVSHNAKTAKILERVNQDGESLTITTLV